MARPKKSSVLDFRILFLAVFILASLFAIGVRLWFVQVKMADYYRGRIQGSSEVTVRIPSIRGEIRDRNGVPLVTNRPSYEVDFYLPDLVSGYKKQYGQPPMVEFRAKDANGMLHDRKEADIVQIVDKTIIPRLEELKVAEPYNSQRLRTHYRNNTLVPFTYREDLDFATFSKFAEKDLGLPGVQVNVSPVRKYVYNALAAHLLGYVGTARDINKLSDIKDFNFYEPDIQGKTNVEFYLDDALRGKPGKRILKKNAKNQLEGEKEVIQPTPGANVYLTIDSRIQYITERALRAVGRAAAVVIDPNNGQILAMASVPSYDPNKFIPAISARDWADLKDADADPLTNRAISAYAPGSTYKIATSLAGLTRGLAKAVYTCNGGVTYGNTYMRCWIQAEHGGTHGPQTLTEAIKNSCDAFFYQYGNAAGIDAIDAVGKSLGLGETSGHRTHQRGVRNPPFARMAAHHAQRAMEPGPNGKFFDWPRICSGYPAADGNDRRDRGQWRKVVPTKLGLPDSRTGRHFRATTRQNPRGPDKIEQPHARPDRDRSQRDVARGQRLWNWRPSQGAGSRRRRKDRHRPGLDRRSKRRRCLVHCFRTVRPP